MENPADYIPHPMTVGEAEQAFAEACRARHETLTAFLDQDIRALDGMAGVLGAALRQIAALVARLDMAVRIHDARGLARPAAPFEPAGVDAYALVEALFWDRLTDEAEQLLKVQLAVELV